MSSDTLSDADADDADDDVAPPHVALLGRAVQLPILRFGPPGIFLALDPDNTGPGAPVVLLPGSEEPGVEGVGTLVDVFVYLDSEDRPVATIRTPKVRLGEVTFLTVKDLTSFGAFFEWGLQKDLLVPLGEQTRPLRIGERHPVGLFVDDTGRLAGTMRISEMLRGKAPFYKDEWVEGEAWRYEPEIGVFVILARTHVALLPKTEPHTLERGDVAKFRVANVHPDGKLEVSLRAHAYEEAETDAQKILDALRAPGGAKITERAEPDEIRKRFGLSKKAFKRAIGRLLKMRTIDLAADGTVVFKGDGAAHLDGPGLPVKDAARSVKNPSEHKRRRP